MEEQISEIEQKIRSTLQQHITIWSGRDQRHRYMNNSLILISIALSVAITIAGIFDQGRLAGVLGAVLAGILAFQQMFPFGELSFFYRVGVAEAIILELDQATKADTPQEVEALEGRLTVLIRRMAQEIPRGQAVHDTVQDMRKAVRDAT